jgi:hypothetical protein
MNPSICYNDKNGGKGEGLIGALTKVDSDDKSIGLDRAADASGAGIAQGPIDTGRPPL